MFGDVFWSSWRSLYVLLFASGVKSKVGIRKPNLGDGLNLGLGKW